MWKLKAEWGRPWAYKAKWHLWLCCLLCVWPRQVHKFTLSSFCICKVGVPKLIPKTCSALKRKNHFPPINGSGTMYNAAWENMSLCIWIWFIGQLLQINSLSSPDCFTAMSYSLEWQSPLMEMEGDSHPENPLLDVAGQNDGGHSKCYYTGPTQYQEKSASLCFYP